MDLEDNNFIYEVGWEYPRANHFVKQSRIDELSSKDNMQGIPLIEKCEAEPVTEPEEEIPVEEVKVEEKKKPSKKKK